MSNFMQTLTSFSGSDLVVSFGTSVIGELQSISWGVQREKAPIYTLGSPDVRSFSRGKRGIAGNLVFAVFDRDSLVQEMRKQFKVNKNFPTMFTAAGNTAAASRGTFDEALGMAGWNARAANAKTSVYKDGKDQDGAGIGTRLGKVNTAYDSLNAAELGALSNQTNFAIPQNFDLITPDSLTYADTLPPMDITATFANEYGQAAFMRVLDLEILNDGSGVSVDTVVMERAMTYIARRLSPITQGVFSNNKPYTVEGQEITAQLRQGNKDFQGMGRF